MVLARHSFPYILCSLAHAGLYTYIFARELVFFLYFSYTTSSRQFAQTREIFSYLVTLAICAVTFLVLVRIELGCAYIVPIDRLTQDILV